MSDKKTTPSGSAALNYGRLVPIEHARRELSANIPAGTKLTDVLKAEFWKHYVPDFAPADIVECICEDGSWEASLRVMYIKETGIEMAERWSRTYDVSEKPVETDDHVIKWISPTKKFGVVHKESGTVVKDGFYPRPNAQKFMATL